VGQEQGPLSLVSTIEELLETKSRDSGLENREYGRVDHLAKVGTNFAGKRWSLCRFCFYNNSTKMIPFCENRCILISA
jgi:hypothetical protein